MRRDWTVGAVVVASALALRLFHLSNEPLTTNEATTAALAHKTWGAIIDGTAQDNHPPFHYLFIHEWARLFGVGELSIRLPSALAGAATAFVVLRWALSLLSPGAALLAGMVIAVSPFHVYYSQEARFYGFLGLEAAVFWWGVTHLGRRWDPRVLALTMGAGIVGLYTHNYFGLLSLPLLGSVVIWCALRRQWRGIRAYLLLGAGMAAAYVPWLPVVVGQARGPGAGSTGPVTPGILQHALRSFMTYGPDVQPWRVASFALLAVVLAGGLVRWSVRKDRVIAYLPVEIHEFVPAAGLLAATGFVYVVCTIKPLFIQKGMIIVLPAYAVLLAATWERLRRLLPRVLLILLVGLLSTRGLSLLYTTPRGKDWRAAAQRIEQEGRQGDLICLREGLIHVPFHYYYFPREPQKRLPELQLHSHLQSVEEQLDLLRGEAEKADRVWLVQAHTSDASIRDSLLRDTSFSLLATQGFGDEGTVTLFRVAGREASQTTPAAAQPD